MSDRTNGKKDEREEPKSGSPANESLRQELLRMQAADQEMRATITRKYPDGTPIGAEDTEW
ncbi:MAG: hypothetical protein HY318_06045 [Armatimonadetes bacterium]|nr:hypothetical protein [Armatimonadota bacterium]